MGRIMQRHRWSALVLLLSGLLVFPVPIGHTAETPNDRMVRYLLLTVHAFREVYVESVLKPLAEIGVEPKEHAQDDPHGVLLPFQFVKLAGAMIKDFDIGLISLTPIYASNFPKTRAEVEALQTLATEPRGKILTFADGNQYKGVMGDFAIEQLCADCHNAHANSHKTDFKKGDLMGAVVIRLKMRNAN